MRNLLVVCLTAAALAGCHPAAPAPDAAVVSAIRSADAPERIHAINEAAFRQRGSSASLVPLLGDQDPRVRWGAAYVAALWADDPADVAALAPHLADSDETVRVMIAGSLAGLGHAEARAALSSLSTSPAPMPFSDPPITVGGFAMDALAAIGGAGGAR